MSFSFESSQFLIESDRPQRSRCCIARGADVLGYVPVTGSIVGLARMVCSVALGAIACVGALCASPIDALFTRMFPKFSTLKQCKFLWARATDEFFRGANELVPGNIAKLDQDRFFAETHGIPPSSHGAYGNFIHTDAKGSISYSFEKMEKVTFEEDIF